MFTCCMDWADTFAQSSSNECKFMAPHIVLSSIACGRCTAMKDLEHSTPPILPQSP